MKCSNCGNTVPKDIAFCPFGGNKIRAVFASSEVIHGMKRFLSTVLMICLVLWPLSVSAFAATSSYNLAELGMSIDIPSDYIVFTRDIKTNDPNLRAYGLTKEGLSSLMLERSIYLNAWDKDANYEIIVTMVDSPFENYNQLSDTLLNGLIPSLKTEYATAGITFIRSDLYQHNQAKFVKIYISQPNNGDTAYGLQFHTAYDGKAINITLQSYSGKIDSSKESVLKKIVDSIHFDTAPKIKLYFKNDAFTYTDKDSGMTFTVPANWVETPMYEEREFIDVKFTSNLEEGLCIIFMSEDMLSDDFMEEAGLSPLEKLMVSRSRLNNSMITKAFVAEMFGCKENDVSMVTYGGKEYFSAEVVTSGTAQGLTISIPMVYLVRCENGYMYMFQINASSSSEYFQDFKTLVSSAKYPVFENDGTALGSHLLLAIIVLLALCLVIVFVCRPVIKKKSIEKKPQTNSSLVEGASVETVAPQTLDVPQERAEDLITLEPPMKSDTDDAETLLIENPEVTESASISFCHRCGNKLMSDSLFCNKCGTKIPTTEEQ